MAARKTTDLTALTAPTANTLVAAVDLTEALPSNQNKKLTLSDLTQGLSAATTGAAGVVQLSTSTSSTSGTLAATPSAVKSAYDLANTALTTASAALARSGGTMTGAITFAGAQPTATTSAAGIVQLSDSISSTSTTLAATALAVKTAYDAATTAATTSVAGVVQLNDTISSTSITQAATANAVKVAYDFAAGRALLTQGTAVNSTSGPVVDFTGLPTGIRRITVMFSNVSTNGTSAVQVQLGTSGGFETTSYVGGATASAAASAGFTSFTSGFVCSFGADSAATTRHGSLVITNLTSNTWTCQGILSSPDITRGVMVAYSKALAGTLTQLRITTVNGTDTFDAGSINILYER